VSNLADAYQSVVRLYFAFRSIVDAVFAEVIERRFPAAILHDRTQ